jgi:putative ABC transport system permease protein
VVKDMSTGVIHDEPDRLPDRSGGHGAHHDTATLSRRKEYGVLKALGAKNSHLYRAVLGRAGISIGSVLLAFYSPCYCNLLPMIGINLQLVVSWASFGKVAGYSLVIAMLSAILPIRQIAGLDPVMVFRGR